MGDAPNQDTDSAAMVEAFRHQPRDDDADTRARMAAAAGASTAAAEDLVRARTDS